jgi:hypothetical protein
MDLASTAGALNALDALDAANIDDTYERLGGEAMTDDELFDVAARQVAVPSRDPANSFVLHAPLELLARRRLLEMVPSERRAAVHKRILWVAAKYQHTIHAIQAPPSGVFGSVAEARDALAASIAAGDLDGVDAAAAWFTDTASRAEVLDLAPVIVRSLAAAGHASIYFSLLGRRDRDDRSALALLRPLAREVARQPGWNIEWVDDGIAARDPDADRFAHALATTPRIGLPGSEFIFPLVNQVDRRGIARELIEPWLPDDVDAGTNAILRVAAHSMLQDDPQFGPYGWTHCLTLPQAVLELPAALDPRQRLAIAATYVVAFRAGESAGDIDLAYEPEPVGLDVAEVLEAEPAVAAAAAWHTTEADLVPLTRELAARGGAHEDAHLAKYTLACFDAARRDPSHTRLYVAAAAYLGAWWTQQSYTSGE